MKKILLTILMGALCLTGVMIWIGFAWIICCFLSVYVYEPFAIFWFILSFVSLGYLWKSIIRINTLNGLVKGWSNIRKYLDLD
jgi:hypothetical protein